MTGEFEIKPRTPEELAAQKNRNVWLAISLLVFVILVGVTTTMRLQTADLSPEGGFYFDGSMETGASPLSEPAS
ncbi:MAG: hypothetical protein AAF613_06455 [Pseudomonadota bacterium]